MSRLSVLLIGCCLLLPSLASAQLPPGFTLSKQWTIERLGENHWKLIGEVEVEQDDVKFFADEIEIFTDTNEMTARGNVVYTSGGNRIAADRMEFNTLTRLGTFYNAAGTASLGDRVDRSMFGTQEPDAYFYGETLEKIGEDRYRITKGGFTTCLQPTPRWEMTSSSTILNMDDYAILKNTLLRVKGVPVFYLPIFYYPIQEDDRATGFLIPMYGSSTVKGQSLSNAFFWAINRSHDVTFLHDWYTATGQGVGGEYRYIAGQGSRGDARVYMLNEGATSVPGADGSEQIFPARRSFNLTGQATQALPANLNLRANVSYFSDVTTQQFYQSNIFDASQRSSTYGANVSGSWGKYSLNSTFNFSETFFGDTESTVHGSTPRISFNVAPTQLGPVPVYVSATSDFTRQVRESKSETATLDQGLDRLDFTPSVRFPFTRWQFLTVTSTFTWHNTLYSESLLLANDTPGLDENVQVPEGLYRQYYDMQADIVGPTFVKIFDTPDNGYAERFKHVIEPSMTIQRTSSIANQDNIVQLDGGDFVVGDATRVRYGVTNRVLAKRRQRQGASVARELLSVDIFQSYYTDPSYVDFSFQSSLGGRAPSKFSPIAINTRATITDQLQGTVRLEYDHEVSALTNIGANGTLGWRDTILSSVGWSRVSSGTNVSSNSLNASTQVRSRSNVLGGNYQFNYDFSRSTFIQQRLTVYYNAQCCGIAAEYQTYDLGQFSSRLFIPQDKRFNLSFTLAGIGTFANFFNALGGAPQR